MRGYPHHASIPTDENGEIPCPHPGCNGIVIVKDTTTTFRTLSLRDGALSATAYDEMCERVETECSLCARPVALPEDLTSNIDYL